MNFIGHDSSCGSNRTILIKGSLNSISMYARVSLPFLSICTPTWKPFDMNSSESGADPWGQGAMAPQTAMFPIATNSFEKLFHMKKTLMASKSNSGLKPSRVQLWIYPCSESDAVEKKHARERKEVKLLLKSSKIQLTIRL